MKRMLFALAASGAAIAMLPSAASAAPWQSINQRQANLYNRIEQGVRSGSLTRAEARRLHMRFNNIARLETRYRRSGGLSWNERRDLDRRFNALSRSVRVQKHDWQNRH